MSKFKEQAFNFLLTAMEKANKFVLHTTKSLEIMNNKLLSAFSFSNHHINIPETFTSFSIPSFRDLFEIHFQKDGKVEHSVTKALVDFSGDGVLKNTTSSWALNNFKRYIWSKEYSLLQRLVPDSFGRSIRVILIGGKAVTLASYNDPFGDFRSNFNHEYTMESLENHEKKNEYISVAEKGLASISVNILIAGVDLLDSKEMGIVVLEINAFPSMDDISKATNKNIAEMMLTYFNERGLKFKQANGNN